jgi:predicted small secreted protein
VDNIDQAIKLADSDAALAYPTIATDAKIDALSRLKDYAAALMPANGSFARLENSPYEEHKAEDLMFRGSIHEDFGNSRMLQCVGGCLKMS